MWIPALGLNFQHLMNSSVIYGLPISKGPEMSGILSKVVSRCQKRTSGLYGARDD